MSIAHDEDGNTSRLRHMSVSHYASNVDNVEAYDPRRRSSIAFAGSISAGAGQKQGVLNQKDDTLRRMSVAVPNLAELTVDAKSAAERERNMVRTSRQSTRWS